MINYYVVLEIPNFSDEKAIKKAYRSLSKKYHPDVNKDQDAKLYFQKINEAYTFLMNENKRLLLNQYLKAVGNSNYQPKTKSEQYAHHQQSSKPIIYQFSSNKKVYSLGDYILIQWNVGNCKSVYLNILGEVESVGSHYLHVKHFVKEIEVLMTLIGFDNQEYKYKIQLKYANENPVLEAFHEVLSKNPNTKIEHFKKESFFLKRGRISKNTFQNRQKLLAFFLVISLILYYLSIAKLVLLLIILFLLLMSYIQAYKRIHDIKHLKYFANRLWIPFYNLIFFKELFKHPSENGPSEFGMMPKQEEILFKDWLIKGVKSSLQKLNLIERISFTAFISIIILGFIQTFGNVKESPVSLTSHYIETSRPNKSGQIYQYYYLVFDKYEVQVDEKVYYAIVENKDNSTFMISKNSSGSIHHITLHDKNSETDQRLNFGILSSSNPILIFVMFLFIGQIYAFRTLKSREEKTYSNGFMIISLAVYLYVLWLMI